MVLVLNEKATRLTREQALVKWPAVTEGLEIKSAFLLFSIFSAIPELSTSVL